VYPVFKTALYQNALDPPYPPDEVDESAKFCAYHLLSSQHTTLCVLTRPFSFANCREQQLHPPFTTSLPPSPARSSDPRRRGRQRLPRLSIGEQEVWEGVEGKVEGWDRGREPVRGRQFGRGPARRPTHLCVSPCSASLPFSLRAHKELNTYSLHTLLVQTSDRTRPSPRSRSARRASFACERSRLATHSCAPPKASIGRMTFRLLTTQCIFLSSYIPFDQRN
jgi:hypothetical protein